MDAENLKTIIKDFGIDRVQSVNPLEKGLINKTYLIETDQNKYILQKIHGIFPDTVTEDIDVVTCFLRDSGITTPLLLRKQDDSVLTKQGTDSWRMATYIEGRTFDTMPGIEFARSAGHLVGQFHRALSGLNYQFRHQSRIWHKTEYFMERLCSSLADCEDKDICSIKDDILTAYHSITLHPLPARHIVHGDLKSNNILFETSGSRAVCLIDLDTLRRGSISLEMGDAVRSWCNPGGEDSGKTYFNVDLFRAAMEGYIPEVRSIVEDHEFLAIPSSAATIALELSARFLEDAHTQSYFQLDSRHYASLYEQNLNKAINSLKLSYDLRAKEETAASIIRNLLRT
ncbi:MAG: phosphotransferase enzyme family protein [bacterium]